MNLIGEHTDYNDGFVLPVAIDRWAVVAADLAGGADSSGNVPKGEQSTWVSLDLDETHTFDMRKALASAPLDWANYLLGVAAVFEENAVPLPNLDLILTSSVPIGAGLSSSAAISVATATVFERAAGVVLEPLTKARWCQQAEHRFAGVPCGLMDPMIASCAEPDHAALIDCRDGRVRLVPMPRPDEAILLIANTHVRHALNTNEYATRRAECETAVEFLRHHGHPIGSLRDASVAILESVRATMHPVLYRRAMHVVTENARTEAAVDALAHGRWAEMGRLMFGSHQSLRDLYEVSCPELDGLVELAAEYSEEATGRDRGVFGARMTGAGFGGCIVALVRPDAFESVSRHMLEGFRARFDRPPTIFATAAVGGAVSIETGPSAPWFPPAS